MLSRVGSKKAPADPSHHSPSSYRPPQAAPTDPLPLDQARPADVLISRLHELKRLSKSLAKHFESLYSAHSAFGKALLAVDEGEGGLRKDWLQGSLFLPPTAREGEGGWAAWCGKVNEGTLAEGRAHLGLAQKAQEEMIEPLRRLHVGIKAFIADLDKHVGPLTAEVLKEREASVIALTHLATATASHTSNPLAVAALEDPVVVRATAELQMRGQVAKENRLLEVVLTWQERTREFEEEVLKKMASIWKIWAEENAKVQLGSRQTLVKLSRSLEAIPADAEWNHFSRLNFLIPPATSPRSLDLIAYPHRDDPSTKPIKEGLLERKKRFSVSKNWKEAFFALSPAGYLHEYRSPSTPLSDPHISLFLPACTVHPLKPSSQAKGGKEKPAPLVIEGRKAATGGSGRLKGSLGMKAREVGRVYRARSTAEAMGWWEEIEKLSKTAFTAHTGLPNSSRQGPARTATQQAGLAIAVVEHGEQTADEGGNEESSDEEDSPTVCPNRGEVAQDVKAAVAGGGKPEVEKKTSIEVPTPAAQAKEMEAQQERVAALRQEPHQQPFANTIPPLAPAPIPVPPPVSAVEQERLVMPGSLMRDDPALSTSTSAAPIFDVPPSLAPTPVVAAHLSEPIATSSPAPLPSGGGGEAPALPPRHPATAVAPGEGTVEPGAARMVESSTTMQQRTNTVGSGGSKKGGRRSWFGSLGGKQK